MRVKVCCSVIGIDGFIEQKDSAQQGAHHGEYRHKKEGDRYLIHNAWLQRIATVLIVGHIVRIDNIGLHHGEDNRSACSRAHHHAAH